MASSMRRAQIPVEYGKIRKCTSHPEKYLSMSCDTCNDQLVCTKCVATIHKSHKFSELDDLAAKKALPLNEFIACSRDQLVHLRAVLNKLKNMKQSADENLKIVIESIKKRMKEIHEQVDKIATIIEEEFKTKVQENISVIESREEFVTSLEGDITKAVDEYQTVLDSQSVWDVIDFKPGEFSFDDKCKGELAELPDVLRYSLSLLDEESATLKHVFGEVKELVSRSGNDSDMQPPPLPPRSKNVATESQFRLPATAEKFNLPFGGITNICVVNEDEAWISYINVSGPSQQSLDSLHHIRRNGDIITTIDVNSGILCLLLTANNSLLASCKDRKLKSITPDGKISDLFKCQGMPSGFCESNNDSIVVCLHDAGRIVKYSRNGKVLQSLANGIIKPFKISQNKMNGEMVITDISKEQKNQRYLVIVDANLKPLWTINESSVAGTPLECKGRFCPNQACFDQKGNMVFVMVNDEHGFVVKVTNQVIQNFLCIGNNSTLSVTASHEIWIGCDSGDIIILKDL